MKRISVEEALTMLAELEHKRLMAYNKSVLVEMLVSREESYLENLSIPSLSNRLGIVTNGEYGVIRTDLGEKE